jgi:hypothetical protein
LPIPLGPRFDVREFYARVLMTGALRRVAAKKGG